MKNNLKAYLLKSFVLFLILCFSGYASHASTVDKLIFQPDFSHCLNLGALNQIKFLEGSLCDSDYFSIKARFAPRTTMEDLRMIKGISNQLFSEESITYEVGEKIAAGFLDVKNFRQGQDSEDKVLYAKTIRGPAIKTILKSIRSSSLRLKFGALEDFHLNSIGAVEQNNSMNKSKANQKMRNFSRMVASIYFSTFLIMGLSNAGNLYSDLVGQANLELALLSYSLVELGAVGVFGSNAWYTLIKPSFDDAEKWHQFLSLVNEKSSSTDEGRKIVYFANESLTSKKLIGNVHSRGESGADLLSDLVSQATLDRLIHKRGLMGIGLDKDMSRFRTQFLYQKTEQGHESLTITVTAQKTAKPKPPKPDHKEEDGWQDLFGKWLLPELGGA